MITSFACFRIRRVKSNYGVYSSRDEIFVGVLGVCAEVRLKFANKAQAMILFVLVIYT